MSTLLARSSAPTPVSAGRYLVAQVHIWARMRLMGVPGAVAVFMVVTCAVQFATGRHGFDDALGFLNLWVVAAGPLLVAVFAAQLAHLDRAARSGGLDVRGVDPRLRVVGSTLVLVAWTAVVHVVAIGTWCVMTVVAGAYVSPGFSNISSAVGTAAGIVAALVGSYLWLCAALAVAGVVAPVVGPSIVAFVTVAIGIAFAESPGWALIPPTWVMRSTLGAIGTHVNGTSSAGAPLPAGPAPFIGSVVLAVAIVAVASAVTDRRRPAVRLRTVVRMVSGPTVPVLAALSVVVVALTLRWRPVSDAASVFALLVLPLGAVVVAALWVARVRGGLLALSTRPQLPEVVGARLLVLADVVVALVVVAVSVIFVVAGAPVGSVVRAAVVFWCVGAMLVAASAVITARLGPVAAITFGLIGTVFGTLVGGTSMYATLGGFFPFAWAAHPGDDAALITTPIAVVAAVVLSVIAARGVYRVRRS